MDAQQIDRYRGCFIGLFCGDALGQPIEFRSPGSFEPVTGYRDGGPHNLNAGQWTDDGSMALALAESIKKGWDLDDQAKQYVDWLENGKYSVNGWCFDIGVTTRQALEMYQIHKDANKSGCTGADTNGNGGIMRIAPVAMFAASRYSTNWDCTTIYNMGVESSAVTHASDMCKSAAGWMTLMLVDLIQGAPREEVLRYRPELANALHPAVDNVMKGSYKTKKVLDPKNWWQNQDDVIRGTGFVVQSLEAALWAFHDAKDFKEAVLKAVNLGEDADTTGAVCGQFAGAYWGESGIPQEWRDGLARMDMIENALASIEPNGLLACRQ